MNISRRTALGSALGLAAGTGAHLAGISTAEASSGTTVPAGEPLLVNTADGLQLSARTFGVPGAPELLFVHGVGQSRLSWNRQVAALARTYRIATFDMRGHGASTAPAEVSAYSRGTLWADDIRAVQEAAGLRRPTLVGWSFGGMTVGHYLKKYGADDLEGVSLVNPVTKFSLDLLGPEVPTLGQLLTSADVEQRVSGIRRSLDLTFASKLSAQDAATMLSFNSMAPREVQLGYAAIGSDGVDAAWGIPRKLMVTFGAKDQITNHEMSRRVLDFNPSATLSFYRAAGHGPHWDEANRFNRELIRFAAR